jgi:hypothetical protein
MPLVKVENSNFIRDTKSMVLNNTNDYERQEYHNKVRILQSQKEEINKVKSEMQTIKNDMSEIKQMLVTLLGKESNG